jgi:hypothetical protein
MKITKLITITVMIFLKAAIAHAQIQADPAHWAYGLKKLTGNTYELHLQCTVDNPWHIYAQKQGKNFIGTATKIVFTKQPRLVLIGKPMELGKKETYVNKEVEITNYELSGKIDFVQKATIKPGIKLIKGTINYQTCTHERCLAATTINFSIPVN